MTKIIAEAKYGQILVGYIVGSRASDLIAGGVPAVKTGAALQEIGPTIHSHPPLSEAPVAAAMAGTGGSFQSLSSV